MKTKIILIAFLLFSASSLFSQIAYDFGFERDNSIVVKDSLGNVINMPWTGGLNAVHFEQMDLNLDGILDLIVFDTHGDRLTTYLNENISDSASYTYAPEYINQIPKSYSWLQTYDYDNDGKMDIFTYVPGGIRVFRNISTSTELKFVEITYMLHFLSEAGHMTNIYVSSVDFPALVDVDSDGDMDILTFHILGSFVMLYQNYSMELYGIPDSLEYKVSDKCWGKFAEHEDYNAVDLHQTCNYKSVGVKAPNAKHTGSTLLILDLNGDTLKDLLLGDVDFFTIIGLINGGTLDSAHMISQDTIYPMYDSPVDIVTFPSLEYIDIDNDGIKELIAAPFDPSYYKPAGKNNVWLYENTGTNDSPVFSYKQNSFLQDQMIDIGDGSTPALTDVDGDGLMDIVMGNYGHVDSTYLDSIWYVLEVFKVSKLAYYRNIGTANSPSFQYMDGDWLGMSSLEVQAFKPTFGDLDDDGDMDLLIGSNDGKLIYKENLAGSGQPMSFGPNQLNYMGIDVGKYSTPQLFDIDGDSLLDLIIGNKTGLLTYYKNTGSATSPVFTHITDSMGHVQSINYWHYYNGYSIPHFYKDENDSLKLFVGSASGFTFYYRDIEQNILGNFGIDTNLLYTDVVDTLYSIMSFVNEGNILQSYTPGFRSSPVVYDFDNDGWLDFITGTFSGGLTYFKGTPPPGVGIEETTVFQIPEINAYPNPTYDILYIDIPQTEKLKDIEVRIYDLTGRLIKQKQYHANAQTQVNTNDLTRGIYVVEVMLQNNKHERASKTFKLVKL